MSRILNEERQRPTIKYQDNFLDWKTLLKGQPMFNPAVLASRNFLRPNLVAARNSRPREVFERPEIYSLNGNNYDLLLLLWGQVLEHDREKFLNSMMRFVKAGGYAVDSKNTGNFPMLLSKVSDMPLIAEFCARTGRIELLMKSAATIKQPTVGLALMLMQLEETIALNFNVFSEPELKNFASWLKPIRAMAHQQTCRTVGPPNRPARNRAFRPGHEHEAKEIVQAIDGILAECNQAIYFYLKGYLQQTRNPEVEADKIKVIGYLDTLGFEPNLKLAIEEAEREYRDNSTVFELKNCFTHLRSFLERLHRDSAKAIATAHGESVVDKWGVATDYLCKKGIFVKKHEEFVTSLYTLISDTSVHPLTAEREYARLLRTVVIEYGVMFLAALEKNGVKIA